MAWKVRSAEENRALMEEIEDGCADIRLDDYADCRAMVGSWRRRTMGTL